MRNVFACVLLLFIPFSLFSQHALQLEGRKYLPADSENKKGNSIAFNIGFDGGMLSGMLKEWVFIDKKDNNKFDFVESRLDWQLRPLFYIGATGSIEAFPRFFVGFGGWLGIPAPLGYMEDRDWNATTGNIISFSHHDNVLLKALFMDINLGYSIIHKNKIITNVIIGFNFKRFLMSARNGYGEYPAGSPPFSFDMVEVINYKPDFFIPYIALETAWMPVQPLTFDIFLSASPFLSFVSARDNHILTRTTYDDSPQFGFSSSAIAVVSYHLGKCFDIRLKNSLTWTPVFKGTENTEFVLNTPAKGGASLILCGISLSIARNMDF